MAERLAKVYGTQMDKVNCPFFYKMGACRYGDSCERIHNKPPISETICLKHMYENNAVQIALIDGNSVVNKHDAENALIKYENFYEEIFREAMKYGQIQDMIVVDNLGDHIVGNVYVKYSDEDYAENSMKHINGRFFNQKKIEAEFSPVTDFMNAKCKQYIDGSCKRGGYCNYMHIKPLSKSFKKQLFEQMYMQYPQYRQKRIISSSEDDDWRELQRNKQRKAEKRQREDQRQKSRQASRSRSKDRKHKDKDKKKKKKRHRSSSSSSKEKRHRKQFAEDREY